MRILGKSNQVCVCFIQINNASFSRKQKVREGKLYDSFSLVIEDL